MNGFHTFMSLGVPAGQVAGIRIRIHFLFFLYVFHQVWVNQATGVAFAIAFIAGIYFCILLHEFGHALSARWCGGDADEILIWPLGGLAYCRPPCHPTPHLITTLGGPLVTLVLWGLLTPAAYFLRPDSFVGLPGVHLWSWRFLDALAHANGFLLLFNMVPAFPMDGGRILRDTLWHFTPIQKANRIASVVGILACICLIAWGVAYNQEMMIFIGLFAFFSAARELKSEDYTELWEQEPWSFRQRFTMADIRQRARAVDREKEQSVRSKYKAKLVPRLEVRDDRRAVEKVDAILEKISRSGMDSLTPEERRELERASTELKRQDE